VVFAHLIFRHKLVQCSALKLLQKGGKLDAREENIRNWKKLDDLGRREITL
jgi:Trm5-related predicted tRNA methylase